MEERLAAAKAVEQEMKARVQEMKAKVVEAEAEVPLAMAKALKEGNIGYYDVLNMDNKKADTAMRNGLAGLNFELKANTQKNDKGNNEQ